MRGRSEGTIQSLGGNRWRVITPRTRGRRSRSRTVTGSKADARAALAELIRDGTRDLRSERITVGDWLRIWLDEIETSRARSTLDSYRRAIDGHIVPTLGDGQLVDLNAAMIAEWMNSLQVGDRTLQNAFAVLRASLNHAVRRRMLESSPMDGMPVPRAHAAGPDPFTPDEVRRIILTGDSTGDWGLYIRIGFGTGLRQGEIVGLQWRDVDAGESLLRVRRQVVEISGRQSVESLKTSRSLRDVPVSDDLLQRILSRRREAMSYGQAADSAHVLCRKAGTLPSRSNFNSRSWRTILKALKIRHRGFHHARHTYATSMLSAGVPLPLVSSILGHSKSSTTLDVYSKWLPSDVDRARQAAASMFG